MQRSVPRSNPKVTIPWQPESAYYNGMVGYLQGGQMEVELRFVVAGKKVSMKTVVRVVPYIAAVNVCGDPNNIYLEIAIAYPKGAKRTKNPTLKIYDDKGKLLHEESRRTTSTEQPLVQYTFTIARSVYEEKLRGHSTLMKLPDVEEGWQEDFSEEIGSGGC